MCNLLLSQIYLHKMKQNIGNAVNEFLIFPAESTLHQPEKNKTYLSIDVRGVKWFRYPLRDQIK